MLQYPMKQLPLLGALALSALLLSACAPVAPRPSEGQARFVEEHDELADYSADLAPMQYVAPPVGNVRELGDGELSCAGIYAETQALDKAGREQQARIKQAQQVMAKSQEDMIKQAGKMPGGMSSIGGSLLGMVPGGNLVSGMAMQAAASARTASIQDGANKMMQTQTELMNAEQSLQHTQARSDHLAALFLDKGCKLSEVERAASVAQ